jgi:hypothetical protein
VCVCDSACSKEEELFLYSPLLQFKQKKGKRKK